MSKEEIAERAGLTLDAWEQGEPIDEISFADDIRNLIAFAIANKVAEQGDRERFEAWYFPKFGPQKKLGDSDQYYWTPAQGAWQAWQAAVSADRASRQVANKAEVEDCPECKGKGERRISCIWPSHCPDCDGTGKVATPPATTGASTVLTDERIAAIWHETACAEGEGTREHPAVFARAIERDVAAQAGQVAVPEDVLRVVRRLLDGSQPQDVPGALMVIDTALAGGAA